MRVATRTLEGFIKIWFTKIHMESESLLKPPLSKQLKSGKVTLFPGEDVGEHITSKREEIIIVIKGNIIAQTPQQEVDR